MNHVMRIFTASASLAVLFCAGCGGDDTSAGATTGSGGGGGTGTGTGAGGGAVIDAAEDATITITCGTTTCSTRPVGPAGMAPPCCPRLEPNTCGALLGARDGSPGVCLTTAPGPVDASCPTVNVNGFDNPGCCSVLGVCGASLTAINLGCAAFVPADAGGQRCGGDGGGSGGGDSGQGGG